MRRIVVAVAVLFLLAVGERGLTSAYAQETTGSIEAHVKDTSGAAVPGANVEVSGAALLAPRSAETDEAGYVQFAKLPPGEYAMVVTAANFQTYRVGGIELQVGKRQTFQVALQVGTVVTTIEVRAEPTQIDVTSSKAAVGVPADIIENIPKGRSFQSLIAFAPGARQEPLQSSRVDRFRANGFQIDGASDSENTYLIEGLDTTNLANGGVKQNVIFEFVEELQVKTSGYEAEYGGALGGVVNVVQKRGSNQFHGSMLTYYRSSSFDANDQCATTPQPAVSEVVLPPTQQRQCGLRSDPSTVVSPPGFPRLDQAAQYYHQKKDSYYILEPGFQLGGPILTDRLRFFSSYVPSIYRVSRTVNFTGPTNPGPRTFYRTETTQNGLIRLDYQPVDRLHLFGAWQTILTDRLRFFSSYVPSIYRVSRTVNFTGPTNPGPRTFYRTETTQNGLIRLDYQPVDRLHLFGAWQYGYSRITGQLPPLPDSATGQLNSIAGNDPATFRPDTGSVNPSNLIDFGGDWTPSAKMIVSARYGYFYYNTADRGKPAGLRYLFVQGVPANAVGLNGLPLTSTALQTGFANLANNQQTIFDVFSRNSFATDVSYFLSKWGTHNFKMGYGFNRLHNNVVNGFNTAEVDFYWGVPYQPRGTTGVANCATIMSENASMWGTPPAAGCRGNAGYFRVVDGVPSTAGEAASYNHSLYVQDSWTVGHGLTLNIGVRFDKEYVPPYKAGASSFDFQFLDKVAPRIGGAYDLFQNGKLKIFASYGKFFDIMKYSLARTYFGGEYWHECVYAIDSVNYTSVVPTSPGGHSCGPGAGPSAGVTVGRFIENFDLRPVSLSTTDPPVDPDIKPMSQHEYVVGADWAIDGRLGLEVRYARKRLDNTIEDFSVADSWNYYGNPGPNTFFNLLHRQSTAPPAPGVVLPVQCAACPLQPKAIRRYDGLESRLTYRHGAALFGQVAYTYSRLRGNYSGLTNTDITDGNGGRHAPNNSRAFDLPVMSFTTNGALVDGPLGTDRPHVLALTGYYRLRWLGMESGIGGNQFIASGTPKSTCIPVVSATATCQFWDQRGTFATLHRDPANGNLVVDSVEHGARMPVYSQMDINLSHSVGVSRTNEAMKIGVELNVLNVFNQGSVLAVVPTPFTGANTVTPTCGGCNSLNIDYLTIMTGWNPITAANAQGYGVTSPRTLSNLYGLPNLFQNRRTMRMALRFSF